MVVMDCGSRGLKFMKENMVLCRCSTSTETFRAGCLRKTQEILPESRSPLREPVMPRLARGSSIPKPETRTPARCGPVSPPMNRSAGVLAGFGLAGVESRQGRGRSTLRFWGTNRGFWQAVESLSAGAGRPLASAGPQAYFPLASPFAQTR